MIFQAEFIAAFITGLVGSMHCLGMCGPIALVTPTPFQGKYARVLGSLIYNSGRILTYTALGLLVGLIGRGFALFQWQQAVSISVGVIIIISALFPALADKFSHGGILYKWNQNFKKGLSSALNRKSIAGVLSIGLINGLLPCGLVYLGLAGSLDMAGAPSGALFMTFFGLGTLPMMSGVYLLGIDATQSFRKKINRLIPVFAILFGALLILRGLGLGIPYVSPSTEPHEGQQHCTIPAHRHM